MTHATHTSAAPATGRDSGGLLASLRNEIVAGHVLAGEFLPTVRRLSEERGVAHGTAWRALKALEAEGLVEAKPRHGYRVLPSTDTAASGGRLAYVLSQENIVVGSWHLIYRCLLGELETCAGRGGGHMMKLIMNPGEEGTVIEQLERSALSGLILDTLNPRLLGWAHETGLPAVVVDDWRPGLETDAVLQANHDGGELAAGHLIELGCERIAWFGMTLNHHGRARYGGVCGALSGAGLGLQAEANVNLRAADLVDRAEKFLRDEKPDGIAALWRPLTAAVSAAADRIGMKIGRDLHLVGWSSKELYEEGFVPLFDKGAVPPAVTWSIAAMAEMAIARLAQRHETPSSPVSCTTVPVRLKLETGN